MLSTTGNIDAHLAAAGLTPSTTAFVDGEWLTGPGPVLQVEDPGTGRMISTVAEADTEVVDAVVRRAHAAWRGWRDTAPAERGRVLSRLAAAFLEHREAFAVVESVDTGKPISQARADVDVTARYLEYYAGAADKSHGETIPQPADTFAFTRREPFGVVAHITPWNAPLSQMMRGVAPCLAAGNTVVVKPSEVTPLSTLLAARLMFDAGLPAGVCNVVIGGGPTTGHELVSHELVRHITFTGSPRGGRAVGAVAAERIVGCNLELGGKSPTIILPDADLDRAAKAGALAVVRNSGQSCFATTRLVVHRSVEEAFVEKLAAKMSGLTMGHGLEDPDVGPLVSAGQCERVSRYLEEAAEAGARVIQSDGALPDGGHFARPAILTGVSNDMVVAREEIFGPVQSVLTFDSLEEAVAIANDTEYGLSAGVFTRDVGTALTVAGELQAGQVQVNRYGAAGVEIPFGGYKTSGLGREKGMEALHHYTQVKSVIIATD